MRIIGFNLTKILAERQEIEKQGIKVNQDINIKGIKEEEIPVGKDKALRINFALTIIYTEDFGKLEFEGSVLTLPNEQEAKSLKDAWKNNKIPEDMKFGIFNFIMNKCNIKALYLEDEMGMPFHVPMPRISKDTPKKKE
tara:strand:+ start:687 stop:1103 length:417 start_codon:yes stop_codon:yes gene_type:complete